MKALDPDLAAAMPRGLFQRRILVLLLALVALLAPIVQLFVLQAPGQWFHSDMAPVMLGVRALQHGDDPYAEAVTRRIQTMLYGHALPPSEQVDQQHFAYPAYIALVLAPLGWLSESALRWMYFLLMPGVVVATLMLWLRVVAMRVPRQMLMLVVLLTFASWPVMWAYRLCQVTLLVAAMVALACGLLAMRRDAMAGVVLAMALIKPQLVLPLIGWLVVWAMLTRRWWFVATLFGSAAGLLVAANRLYVGWLPGWLTTLSQYARYTHLLPMPELLFGVWLGRGVMLCVAIATAWMLWRVRRAEAGSRGFGMGVALVLALTICVMPTIVSMNYNQVLLMPGVLLILFDGEIGRAGIVMRRTIVSLLVAGYAIVLIAILGEMALGRSSFWNGLPTVPLLVLPLITTIALLVYAGGTGDGQTGARASVYS